MTCCKEKILCSIIKQLQAGSPCENEIPDIIPVFWELVCYESGGNCHLQALLTKREAILFLMGCEAYNVDTSESHYTMAASTISDTISDFNSQSQATGSSTKYQNGTGSTRYDEKSSAQKDANSKRTGRSTETSDGNSFYRDDGKGGGFNNSQSFNFIENRVNHHGTRTKFGLTEAFGYRRDCNYEYSTNNTNGGGFHLVLIAGSQTGSASEWRKYQRTYAHSEESDRSDVNVHATENDTGLTTSRGTHKWESIFIADIDWFEQEYIVRIHNERFDARSDARAHADGNGDGISEERIESHNSAQATALASGKSDTLRTHSRVSNRSAFALANSQRFGNLMRLYDQLNEQVNHLRKRLRQNSPPLIDIIPCNCEGSCNCMPSIRRCGYDFLISATSQSPNSSNLLRYS